MVCFEAFEFVFYGTIRKILVYRAGNPFGAPGVFLLAYESVLLQMLTVIKIMFIDIIRLTIKTVNIYIVVTIH